MRKYHSLLNAALPAPFGRTIMLNYVEDLVETEVGIMRFSGVQTTEAKHERQRNCLASFRLENGIPHWIYEKEGTVVEKSLFLIHRQNTLCVSYKLLSAKEPVELKWKPYFHMRAYEQAVNAYNSEETYEVNVQGLECEIQCNEYPTLRIYNESSSSFTLDQHKINNVYYCIEEGRGYESCGCLTSPGYFSNKLKQDQRVFFIVSAEEWSKVKVLSSKEAWRTEMLRKKNLLRMAEDLGKRPMTAKLVLAADQFIMMPHTRYQDIIRLHAAGEEIRSIIAGYPWFTDWGRDTMISLEGLTLATGRERDAYAILHTFAHYVKNGLIPNMFPDGEDQGIYNTSDATLWFFHAIDRYVELTGDDEIIEYLLPTLHDIIQSHLKGTLFGIRADEDGLLIQGQEGYQLTWMDAKVGEWVVTPRRGKAVEINALWYNALRLYQQWSGKELEITKKCRESFNRKFWNQDGCCLYDVVEGQSSQDGAIRPNQLFAISLKYPVLDVKYWKPVLEVVQRDLLTPVGLRTLSPTHPEYKANYFGDLRARDAAYHQGTVWPWLLGPFIDVWLKVYPEDYLGAYELLKELIARVDRGVCLGSEGEIFDATAPYTERGCFAQAWSVAELLRCLAKILPKVDLHMKEEDIAKKNG